MAEHGATASDRDRRIWALAAGTVVLLAIAAVAAGVVIAFERSLIPVGVSGTVEGGEWLDGSGQRLRVVEISGERFVVDSRSLEGVEAGEQVLKRPWERSLETSRGRIGLGPSEEFVRMALSGAIVLALVCALVWRSGRMSRPSA